MQDAAAEVGLSRRSAYALRRRAGGQAFDLGWQAADLLACDSLRETLWDRARNGQSWTTVRDDGERVVTTTRHRFDNRLALAMLTRLEDKLADAPTAPAARMAGKFEHLLAHIEAGPCSPDTAALVDFLDPPPSEPDAIGTCEPCEPEAQKPGADPADMTVVWYDPDDEQWLTLLPAPDGFDGEEHGGEKDGYYYRTLSEDEEAAIAHLDPMQCRLPRTARAIAGESLRTDWFAAAARARRIEDVPGLIDEALPSPPSGRGDGAGAPTGEGVALEN